jgi:hypothetical protein
MDKTGFVRYLGNALQGAHCRMQHQPSHVDVQVSLAEMRCSSVLHHAWYPGIVGSIPGKGTLNFSTLQF